MQWLSLRQVGQRSFSTQAGRAARSWLARDALSPRAQIVAMACARYFIERSFQDAKTSLGLADYQTRGWLAWHHHMALVMLAMQFQLRERVLQAQEHPLLSTAAVVEMLRHHLLTAAVTPEEFMAQFQCRHRKRKSSIDSACRQQRPSR